jgi:hypothetical protein
MARGVAAGLVALAAVVLVGAGPSSIKSGPQVGERVPGPFEPLNVTGPDAGEQCCLFCKYGGSPVVMVFARDTGAPLTALLKKVDEAAVQHRAADLGACAVFLSADAALKDRLKETAREAGLKELILAIDKPAGPDEYKIAPEAEVTVLLYVRGVVKANHAFRKGELTEKGVAAVAADLAKILPEK